MEQPRLKRNLLTDICFNEFVTNLCHVLTIHQSVSDRTRESILLTLKDAYENGCVVMAKDEENGVIHPDLLDDTSSNEAN